MPNLRGASPVGQDEGGRSYVTRTVRKVISRGKIGAARSMARECVGVILTGQTTQTQSGCMMSGLEDRDSTRSGVGSHQGCGNPSDYPNSDTLAIVGVGSPHGRGSR